MPQVSAEKLIERLAAGGKAGAVALIGTDHYLREMCRNKIIEVCVPEGARDWAVTRVSARDTGWDEILRQAETMPMMASRQVIVVEGAEAVEKLGDKSRDEALEALKKYLDSPAPFTVLLIEAAGLDGRQRFRKLLNEKAQVVELEVGEESAALLTLEMARNLGAEIEREAATLLAEIVNHQPARIRMELEKLDTYASGRRITAADVGALVVAARQNTIWQFTDMLASRKREAAFSFLDNLLREGEQPAGIVGALAWMYRKLIEARELPANTSGFQASRPLGMRPESAEAAVRQAHRIPKKDLLEGLAALAEADSRLKSANPNPRATMEFLIARLTSSPSVPTSRTA